MGDVLEFKPQRRGLPIKAECEVVADNELNRQRDNQGPPIGEPALCCTNCRQFAFYLTLGDVRCYYCHEVQIFQ